MNQLKREELQKGIYFNSISDERFKTNRLSLYLVTPMSEQTVAVNALIPNLLRKGYEEYPDFTSFNRYLNELYGAYADGNIDKVGDNQLVSLSVTAIDDRFTLEQEKMTKEIAHILGSMLLKPVWKDGQFIPSEVELEKNILIDEIRSLINDKRSYAVSTAIKLMCQNEPYGIGKHGTIQQVQQITPQTLTTAYQNLLKQAHIEVMFVGCGDAEIAKQELRNSFSKLERTYQPISISATHEILQQTLSKTDYMDVTQSKMVLGFGTGINSESEQVSAMRLMTAVFGGTPTSKLFLNVREKLSLCYYCAARFDRMKGIITVDCGVEEKNIEQAKQEIINQLEQIKQGNITDEEIQNAVLSLENSYQTVNDSNAAVSGFYLGEILANTIRTPEQEAALIKSVTKEQIIKAANMLHLDIVYLLTGEEK